MEITDCGKSAKCGINGADIIVSKYNYKCPCLNCVGCGDKVEPAQCGWRHVLETNPCTNEDMREILCINCIKEKQM